jgi:hypothetical protein
MTRFRARPLVIEAWPWYPGREVPGVFVQDPYRRHLEVMESPLPPGLPVRHFVVTADHRLVYLEPGDWVVPEADGVHHRVIKPDEMASGYDPID